MAEFKTEYLKLTGKIKWANGRSGGLFTQDPEYGGYKCNLYPDQKSWDAIKKSHLDLKSRSDEDGDYIIFKRPHEKMFQGDRKLTYFGPPKVFFVEGITPTKDIGNGSEVEINVVVYPAGRYVGHRLNDVIVTELVKYERDGPDRSGLVELKIEDSDNDQEESKEEGPPFDDPIPFGNDEVEEEKPSVNPFKKRSK